MAKKKKEPKVYTVYKIVIEDVIRYIGVTNNIKRRTYEHNYHFLKGENKDLYNFIRAVSLSNIKLELIPVYEFDKKVNAKRMECYLILNDFFFIHELKQKPPNISDR